MLQYHRHPWMIDRLTAELFWSVETCFKYCVKPKQEAIKQSLSTLVEYASDFFCR
jgi:hypothetical protein